MGIYYLRCKVTGLTKIGFSEGDPISGWTRLLRRVRSLQTQMSCDSYLVSVAVGDRAEERKLHTLHAKKWKRGEWFELNDSDIPYSVPGVGLRDFNAKYRYIPRAVSLSGGGSP